jgi:hypothetical protein
VQYQGVLFPTLEMALSVFTRVCSLERLPEHISLALHVTHRHRWIYDRAEHMLSFYGGSEMYVREIRMCVAAMEMVRRHFNYPDGEEVLEYESDAEDGVPRRPPYPVVEQRPMTGVLHLPSPLPSPVMTSRVASTRILPRRTQVMLMNRQVVVSFDERRALIRQMEYQHVTGVVRAPYFTEADNSVYNGDRYYVSRDSMLVADGARQQVDFGGVGQEIEVDGVGEELEVDGARQQVDGVGQELEVDGVRQQVDGPTYNTLREEYGEEAEGISRHLEIGLNQYVTDEVRLIIESARIRLPRSRDSSRTATPDSSDEVNRTVREEYGRLASAISRQTGISMDETVTPEVRELVISSGTPPSRQRQVNLAGHRLHQFVDDEVGALVEIRFAQEGTIVQVYGPLARIICRRLNVSLHDIVTAELEAQVRSLDPPIVVRAPSIPRPQVDNLAHDLHQLVDDEISENLGNTVTQTLREEFDTRALFIARILGYSPDRIVTNEIRAVVNSHRDAASITLLQAYGHDAYAIARIFEVSIYDRAVSENHVPIPLTQIGQVYGRRINNPRETILDVFGGSAVEEAHRRGVELDHIVTREELARIDSIGHEIVEIPLIMGEIGVRTGSDDDSDSDEEDEDEDSDVEFVFSHSRYQPRRDPDTDGGPSSAVQTRSNEESSTQHRRRNGGNSDSENVDPNVGRGNQAQLALTMSERERLKKHSSHPFFNIDIYSIYGVLLMQLICCTTPNKINIREIARRSSNFIERMRDNTLTRHDIAQVRRYARSMRVDVHQVVAVFTSRLPENTLGFFFIYDPYCEDATESSIVKLLFATCQALQFTFLQQPQSICSSVYYFVPQSPEAKNQMYKAIISSTHTTVPASVRFPLERAFLDQTAVTIVLRFREPLMIEPLICPVKRLRRDI